MSRERGTPDRTPASGKTINHGDRSANPMPHRSLNAQQMRPNPAKKTPLTQAVPVGSASAASPPHPTAVGVSRKLAQRKSSQRKLPNWMTDWRFFTIVGLSVTGGVTALSIAFLFKMPALPNCPAVFWPLASASLRLHCAQLAANKETVPDLLEAITLLHTLGKDHPLYPEASRLIEDWSAQILDLAEADFQAGKLEDAIAAARKIPPDTAAAKLVDNQVGRWQTIWSKAAGIYNQAGEVLKKANLQQAQEQAARLLSIDNEYWRTTKYAELNNLIIATRKDITRLGKAERALRSGVVDDIVASLQEIAGILKESFVYKDAQELIPKLGRKLLDLAESALERRDYNTALDIANRIPGNIRLDQEVDDFRMIAQAQSRAWNGGVLNLEDAIADAQRIQAGRPLYDKAQRLIERWQVEIRETAALDQAKQLAQAGDLQNAIAQAAALSPSNQSAQAFLRETRGQAQVQVDRPILDQAEQMAIYGDAKSLEAAIAQAQQIGRGRSLYAEAQERIQLWSKQLRGLRDQAAAQEVGVTDRPQSEGVDANGVPGITEFNNGSAAAPVATQRSERSMLQRARSLASSGAPDDLMQAIGMAQGVPDASPVRADAVAAIDQWSQQMVQSARSQAAFDVSSAIAIVQRVPPGTSGYADAQALLKQWQRSIDQ